MARALQRPLTRRPPGSSPPVRLAYCTGGCGRQIRGPGAAARPSRIDPAQCAVCVRGREVGEAQGRGERPTAAPTSRCKGVTERGTRCRARVAGGEWCRAHEDQAARKSSKPPRYLDPSSLSPRDVQALAAADGLDTVDPSDLPPRAFCSDCGRQIRGPGAVVRPRSKGARICTSCGRRRYPRLAKANREWQRAAYVPREAKRCKGRKKWTGERCRAVVREGEERCRWHRTKEEGQG